MYKEDPTQGIPDELQRTHSSERVNSDSEGDASKVETQKWKHSTNTHFRKYERDGRARKRISEQSPIRCRGTRSHHSVDVARVKQKLHSRRRRILGKFSEPSKKPKENLANIVKNHHRIIGLLYLID